MAIIATIGLLAHTAGAAADTEFWTGIPGTTTTTNWSDTGNWAGTTHVAGNNNLYFTNNGPAIVGTVDNVVDASVSCNSLNFTNNSTTHTTLILPGQILTIAGVSPVQANFSLNANPVGQTIVTNTITGPNGEVLITGASAGGIFVSTTNSSAANIPTTLDLSGLGTLIINNTGANAAIWVGNGANRCDGVLNLAMTNYLSLASTGTGNSAAVVVGDNTSNNGSSPGGTLNLGQTNTILADNISVGMSKQNSALMRFNPAFTNAGANPVVYIRGFSGTPVKKWSIGDGLGQSGTSPAGSGTVDFRNGTVNAIVTALVVGRPSSTGAPAPSSAGTLSLSAGSFSVVTLTNALMTTVAGVGTSTNQTATGTINVTGTATFSVNNVLMSVLLGTGGSATGALNITNGTLAVGTMVLGGGTSTINENSGTLIVTNTVGTTAVPLSALNLNGGTVQLTANGASSATNIVANAINTNGAVTTINIASVAGVTGTTTIPLLSYAGGADPFGNLTLAPLPIGFTGNLSDDAGKIDLIVSPPAAAASIAWVGATNSTLVSSWDVTTANWVDLATRLAPTAYADLDTVQFDDAASNGVVTLNATVAPFLITVTNNALNYSFGGSGKISGVTGLIKNGSGSLTLAESGGDSFTGGLVVSNGTLVLDNAGSAISGGLNLVAGTVQVGNNDTSGSLPTGTIVNNGTIIFNRTDSQTISSAITGTGSITKNNNNTLTLGVNSTFAGGLNASSGTLRLSTAGAAGTGTITVNPGGTVVLGVQSSNNIVLSGGTLGISASLNPFTNNVAVTPGTTSIVCLGDPQNLALTDANEMAWSNTITGSGTFIVTTVTNDTSADSGNGFRLRGITASSFSGTIVLSNDVKGELQAVGAGPFSPAGSGLIVVACGSYYGTNGTLEPGIGGYSEFNVRNNSSGDTVFGNNVQIAGAGLALLDPLGSAPVGAKVTMGNLQIGGGQELGVYLAAGANAHVVVFPTVSLTGGTATFSPKTPGFGATTSVGSDLVFGNISESAASGIIMNGLRTLTLTGNNTYSGSTVISNGTFEVDGTNHGVGSVTVAAGTLTGVGTIAGPVTIAVGGTLSPGNASTPSGTLAIANTLTLGGTNLMNVNKTGATITGNVITNITTANYGGTLQLNLTGDALAAGDAIKLYGCVSGAGAFAAIVPATPGTGLLWNTNTLNTGVLSVISAVKPTPVFTSVGVSGTTLSLSATNGANSGQFVLLGTTNLTLPLSQWVPVLTNNFDASGNLTLSTNIINPALPVQFYTIQQ